MSLLGIDIKIKWHYKDVDSQKCHKCLEDVMLFKGELVFHWVPLLVDGVTVDQPDVVVDCYVLLRADPGTVLVGSVPVASNNAHVPESENTQEFSKDAYILYIYLLHVYTLIDKVLKFVSTTYIQLLKYIILQINFFKEWGNFITYSQFWRKGFFGGGSINIIEPAYQILNIHFVKIKLWC